MERIYTQQDMDEAIDDAVSMLYTQQEYDDAFFEGYTVGFADAERPLQD